jgi:hypothetical protein
MDKNNFIFDLTDFSKNYRGVLFAEVDNEEMDNLWNSIFGTSKRYVAGVMAVIWTDKDNKWFAKMRIKFPSGSKHVVSFDFSTPEYEKINVNETFILQYLYQMPMVNKIWTPNPSGDGIGIVEIMEKLDMIESKRYSVIE